MKSIYLDIDGTLINKDGTLAFGAIEFVKYCVENFDTYWLTTHCKGDAKQTLKHIIRYFPIQSHQYLEKIKPTDWGALKTDALNFSENFIWFDDYLMQSELQVLEDHNAENKHIMINLEENPKQLEEMLDFLKSINK